VSGMDVVGLVWFGLVDGWLMVGGWLVDGWWMVGGWLVDGWLMVG
jgi:hypothetical protein